MLIPRSEVEYDFKGARFDLDRPSDRRILGWVFNQFLYGEVTGIQCGHWLYHAPHLGAATFLARQASEELSHVRKILRILSLLGEWPAPAHWSIRTLSTGMMGRSWGEHVAIEMALGEGLVLSVFYALARTVPQPEILRILESAISEEERHVEFGERETEAWLDLHPESRNFLLTSALIQLWVLKRLQAFVVRRVCSAAGKDHPVLCQLGEFYEHTLQVLEERVSRLELSDRPLRALSLAHKASLMAALPWGRFRARFGYRTALLTSTYLKDPALIVKSANGSCNPPEAFCIERGD